MAKKTNEMDWTSEPSFVEEIDQKPVEQSPLEAARSAVAPAKVATRTAAESVAEAERTFDGLLPAAIAGALDPKIHSTEEIQRGYDLAHDAYEKRNEARSALVDAWTKQEVAEIALLDTEHKQLMADHEAYSL